MIRGSAKIDFERHFFVIKSKRKIKLKAYSRNDILDYIENILILRAQSTGEKRQHLQRIIEDLELIYSVSNGK